jgi:mono/diheme cytochrome c family protein
MRLARLRAVNTITKGLLTGAIAASLLAFAAGCRGEPSEVPATTQATAAPRHIDPDLDQRLPAGLTVEMVVEGRDLFDRTCIACHGPGGEGTQLGPSLRDEEWIHGDGSYPFVLGIVRDGVEHPKRYPVPMPALGGGDFTREEIAAVAAYAFALRLGVR